MRCKRIVAGASILWLGLILCGEAYESLASQHPSEQAQGPPSIDAIRKLAELSVLEVDATKMVATEIKGHAGGISAIVLVRATVTIGVDLEQAEFVDVDKEQQHLVLSLPVPGVHRAAIDHEASQMIYSQRKGLWRMALGPALEDELIANAYKVGEQRLKEAASQADPIDRAKRHAKSVLRRFIDGTGWTLTISWSD